MVEPDKTSNSAADEAPTWRRHRHRLAPEIEEIAVEYCGGERDPILYQRARAIAQCDLMIFRLRAQAVRILESFTVQRTSSGSEHCNRFEQANDISEQSEQNDLDALQSALPDLDRLDRIERRIWLRRKRALGTFFALKK